MSGGVDSSVTAVLLKQQGFDVIGVFMKNWSEDFGGYGCTWAEDAEDARKVAQVLKIPFYVWNFEKEYRAKVVDYFLREYRANRTPNPDVMCNNEIKFKFFLDKALKLGADFVATGHYARITKRVSRNAYHLLKGVDPAKDQSYFLYTLRQKQLAKILFPIGGYKKSEIRRLARKFKLPTADKKDSQGICFIGKLPVREFLKNSLDLKPGKVMATDGSILGEHEGAQLYTIGQRHIGVAANGKKMYVANIDTATNTVVMAEEASLYTKAISFGQSRWFIDLPENFECDIQTRYRTPLLPATVSKNGIVRLKRPARAVTPGQYIAFYKIDQLIGSAVIS